jgi:hypothetical protein
MTQTEPDDTMRERVGDRRSRLRLAAQLNAGRLWLTLVISALFFALLSATIVATGDDLLVAMNQSDPIETLFQGYVTALITGVTLVVTISQLVLSQELGPLGDQRERMEGAVDFRQEAKEYLGTTPPPEPAAFLQAFVEVSGETAERLAEVAKSRDDVQEFLDELTHNADAVASDLDDAQFGRYQVVKSALDFNYSWKIYQARRLRRQYADDLSDEEAAAFDDLIDILSLFGPAREHIKTLFFQWELVGLSRKMVYVSFPALLVAVAMILVVGPETVPGALLGVDNVVWLVAAAATVCSVPFFLLGVYMIRLATIARRTLAIGPFILRESGRSDDLDWES